jgi:very-short-patch-repair endonuclease
MKVRMEQSLTGLGLRYQSETNVSSRFIDFLIEDDIILEVDGLHHFCLNSLQLTDKTQARNVHLLLKGYRMMMINIYEYNIAREKEDLMELIKCKL